MRSVIVALAVGLVLIAITVITVLAHSPLTVAGTNSISSKEFLELKKGGFTNCQSAGTLPQGTSAIRVGIEGVHFSPAVSVSVSTGSRVLRYGKQIAGVVSAPTVTVPIKRLANAVSDAHICTAIGPAKERIRFYGMPSHSSASTANPVESAYLSVQYLRPGPKSWWSFLPSITYHMGLGHSPSGGWVAYLVLAIMLAVVILTSRLILEELR